MLVIHILYIIHSSLVITQIFVVFFFSVLNEEQKENLQMFVDQTAKFFEVIFVGPKVFILLLPSCCNYVVFKVHIHVFRNLNHSVHSCLVKIVFTTCTYINVQKDSRQFPQQK
jgi:hypothetical protein